MECGVWWSASSNKKEADDPMTRIVDKVFFIDAKLRIKYERAITKRFECSLDVRFCEAFHAFDHPGPSRSETPYIKAGGVKASLTARKAEKDDSLPSRGLVRDRLAFPRGANASGAVLVLTCSCPSEYRMQHAGPTQQ